MDKVIKKVGILNNCLVIVGDTHLRSLKTRELGPPSPLYVNNVGRPDTFIVRSDNREIDKDKYPKGTISREEFFKIIKSEKFIRYYKRRGMNVKFGK